MKYDGLPKEQLSWSIKGRWGWVTLKHLVHETRPSLTLFVTYTSILISLLLSSTLGWCSKESLSPRSEIWQDYNITTDKCYNIKIGMDDTFNRTPAGMKEHMGLNVSVEKSKLSIKVLRVFLVSAIQYIFPFIDTFWIGVIGNHSKVAGKDVQS